MIPFVNDPPSAETEHKWRWMRVYYFEQCKDLLILDAIWPAVQKAMAGHESRAYFERDWIGGPNVLLGFHGFSANDLEHCAAEIREYLRLQPSTTGIAQAESLSHNAMLGVLESRRPEDLQRGLQANNTVLSDCEEPYSPLLQPGPLKESVRHFLCRSSEIAVNWMETIRADQAERTQIAIMAMIALAWVANPRQTRPYISFRSHANGLLRFVGSRRLEQEFSRCYLEREGAKARNMITTTIAALESGASLPRGFNEYVSLMRETLENYYRGFQDGVYGQPPVKEIKPISDSDPNAELSRRLNQLVKENHILRAWRVTINLLYLLLNELGISAMERGLACYLLSRAAEDVSGESIDAIVRELARTGDAGRVISLFAAQGPERVQLAQAMPQTGGI
jgi:lantibiotic biosynthesis dehydratase-like protein